MLHFSDPVLNRKTGRYQVRIRDDEDSANYRVKSLRTDDLEVAVRKVSDMRLAELYPEYARIHNSPTVAEFKATTMAFAHEHEHHPTTEGRYEHITTQLVEEFGEDTKLVSIPSEDGLAWWAKLTAEVEHSTHNCYLQTFLAAVRRLHRRLPDLVTKFAWPLAIERKPLDQRIHDCPASEEVDLIADWLLENSRYPWTGWATWCLAWTGLRQGTLLRMRWEHVDLQRKWLYIPAGIMKENNEVSAPLHTNAWRAFSGWYAERQRLEREDFMRSPAYAKTLIFPALLPDWERKRDHEKRRNPRALHRELKSQLNQYSFQFNRALKALGLVGSHDRPYTPHDLKRHYMTWLIEHEVDPIYFRMLTGNVSMEVIRDHYLVAKPGRLEGLLKKAEELAEAD